MPILDSLGSTKGYGFTSLGESYFMAIINDTNTMYGVNYDSSGNIFCVNNSGKLYKVTAGGGSLSWQRNFTSGSVQFEDVAVASSGNIYAVGECNPSSQAAILVKFDSTGAVTWQRYLETSTYFDKAYRLFIDSSENIFIFGQSIYSGSTERSLVAKYDSAGTLSYKQVLASNGWDRGRCGFVDSSGNTYLAAQSNGSTPGAVSGLSVAKLNSTATTVTWARVLYNASGSYEPTDMKVDSSGNVYVCGQESIASGQCYLAKFDSAGTLQWQRKLGGNGNEFFRKLDLDSSNNIYVVGYTRPSSQFDMVIAKYNTSGTIQWQRRLYTSQNTTDYLFGLKLLNDKTMVVSGAASTTSGQNNFIAQLPTDGSKTGAYTLGGVTFTYAAGSLTDSAASASSTSQSPTMYAAAAGSSTGSFTNATTANTFSKVGI